MLIEKHAVVHLHGGSIWTSLRDSQNQHDEALNRSDIHLIYLGRGNFAKLTAHEMPLDVVEETPNSQSIVIGSLFLLTPSENKAIDTMMKAGLGVAIAKDESKPATLASTSSTPVCVPEIPGKPSQASRKIAAKFVSTSLIYGEAPTSDRSTSAKALSKPTEKETPPDVNRQRQLCLTLRRINAKPGDRITVNQELLDSIPSSKYSSATWQ